MRQGSSRLRLLLGGAAALALGIVLLQGDRARAFDPDDPYVIRNGQVDFGTFNGFRRYHAACHTCHGPDGLGSSYAPSLTRALERIGFDEFAEVVVNGRTVRTAGGESVMPSFGHVEDVMLYLNDIYAYLKARSDGALGRGRPDRLPPEEDPVWQERRE